ncbi:hypothetical protein ACIRH0_33495 [Streptomyces sp. NPDC093675]|uniref:hypothetical protein n=1 Tax=Streptomyces sp. NPDC093675 TaxID=3366049 RepID=UPI00382C4608
MLGVIGVIGVRGERGERGLHGVPGPGRRDVALRRPALHNGRSRSVRDADRVAQRRLRVGRD